MDLLYIWHDYIETRIGPKFYSALSPLYDLEVKVTDLEIVCYSFTSNFLKDLVFIQLVFKSYYSFSLYLVYR